ncbi:putative polyprotein [Tanacetum coccineum]
MLAPSGGGLILYQAYGNLYDMTGRKAHLLEDKQIPSVGVFDEVLALGWHLEEIQIVDPITVASYLEIPPENAYIILETDGCMEGWGGISKWKKRKGDPRSLENICAYRSGKFSTTQSIVNAEINACINTLEKLKIYYLYKHEVTLRKDCQAIISFYNKTNSNKSSRVRWIKFVDAVTGAGVKINIEHIKGKHNTLVDSLSRLVNLCFAECIEEMKQLAASALYSVEEVLQSPYAFHKNMKITCKEVMKISNHFQESLRKLSSHMKNQEHYTDITNSN